MKTFLLLSVLALFALAAGFVMRLAKRRILSEKRRAQKPTKDKCVICRQDSPYDRDTPIEKRLCYIEGMGQLCGKCYNATEKPFKPDLN